MCAVTEDLTGKVQAGKLIGEVAKVGGGRGGGKPDMAQAGGKEPDKLPEALVKAKAAIHEQLAQAGQASR